ncbi:MAG TPA: hypothetical protein VE981_04840 [Planctomycetota bacterium]|nr:hypothetical protein [Planctomycetota bacterium]
MTDAGITHLHTRSGTRIPVRVETSREGKTLVECHEPGPFLEHITEGRVRGPLGPDTILRGVVIPLEGATFTLFDQFGVVADEIVRLNDEEAHQRLLDALW